MPLPVNVDIERTAGDRYPIEDFQIQGLDDITGLTSQLRIAQTDGTLIGVLSGTVTDGTAGTLAFYVDDVSAIRDLAAGSYVYALILDPAGGQRRTYATGGYVIEAQPVTSEDDDLPSTTPVDTVYTVAAGTSRAAVINATLETAAGVAAETGIKQTVQLRAGTYYLETAIVGQSGVELCGVRGKTILIPTFTGGADAATNYVIGVDGAINTATINTTLTTKITKNKSTTAVAAVGTLTASDWFLVEGRNVPAEDGSVESNGTSVVLSELMLPAASYAGGTTIATRWPWAQAHGTTGITVRGVTPVIGFAVRDLEIQGSVGGVTTAVGVFARYCSDVTVTDVVFSGCSRMGVEFVGCRDAWAVDNHSKGNNNGWMMWWSVINGHFDRLTGDQGVARLHASGYPRYPVFLRSRCTNITFGEVHITGTIAGMYIGGGQHIAGGTVKATDVSILKAEYDRMVASGELDNTAPVILGFGTGMGPIALAELSFDIRVEQIHTENLRAEAVSGFNSPAPIIPRAVYLHDVFFSSVGAVHCVNRGETSDVATVAGVTISDYAGHIDTIDVAGHVYGLSFDNSANDVVIDRYSFRGNAGTTPNSTIPIYCSHTAPSAQTIHIKDCRIANASSAFRTGGSFAGDFRFRVDHLNIDGAEWTDCIIGRIDANRATGDVLELDSTATANDYQATIITAAASGYERRLVALCTGDDISGASYVLICPLPARIATVLATSGLVTRGGLLRHSGTGTTTVQEDAAATHPIGVARDYKAAGSTGLIRIGLVNP